MKRKLPGKYRHQATKQGRRVVVFPEPSFKRLKKFFSQLARVAGDHRYPGHRVSHIFRYLFENAKIKKIFGINLAAVILLTSVVNSPISALSGNPTAEITTVSPSIIDLTTNDSVRVPLDSFEITQGYHAFHRAVDLNGALGEPVFPIMDGVVETIAYGRFSYGNHLVIDHGSGFKSLYAHLGKIIVKESEAVDKNTVIATVGSTGWVTGSHLHLEVYDNGRPFNPLTILK